ncbi:MAG: AIR synthase-related protein [Lachnospiraceae bacterium]
MKTGRIPENVLKRSVLKQIKPNNDIVLRGAAVGADCAFIRMGQDVCAAAQGSTFYEKKHAVSHAMHKAANNLAAGGAVVRAFELHLMLPEDTSEPDLKQMMAEAQETAVTLNAAISGGHTEVLPAIQNPVVSVTALGFVPEGMQTKKEVRIGQDIVMTKWIGLSGTSYLANEREAELLTTYPAYFIKDAQALEQYYSVIPEAATAIKSGVSAMHDVSSGGVFGALWELGEHAGVGLTISLKKIPVKQETIEVCEFFDLNPYELSSDGAMLMIADDGYALTEALSREGIAAQVIGNVTAGRDKVIINEEEKRFLEPPRTDEIYKIRDIFERSQL